MRHPARTQQVSSATPARAAGAKPPALPGAKPPALPGAKPLALAAVAGVLGLVGVTAASPAAAYSPALQRTATATALGATPATCASSTDYGRMFPSLPKATWSLTDLTALSEKMVETEHFAPTTAPLDEMHNFPSGYTYTGQFLDHDIALDPRPNDLTTPVDATTLKNARTPQLDLDSVYIKGPSGSPQAYEADGVHFKLGSPLTGAESDRAAHDLYRGANGQAVIGDPRNDENKLVASLASIMTRAHNHVVDTLRRSHPDWSNPQVFATAKQQVTWYYQWAILTDFLPKVVGTDQAASVVRRSNGQWATDLRYYNPCNGTMPVEFSGAAYRFGHSIVRDDYQINEVHEKVEVFTADGDPSESLVGFGPSPSTFAVDWKYFFPLRADTTPQNAYQMDGSLIPALRLIPGPAAGTQSTILATRNLLRGQQIGLPSGQDVARAMGVTPLPDSKIMVGPAVGAGSPQAASIATVSPQFAGKAPLWAYLLAEAAATNATLDANGHVVGDSSRDPHLGPVGGRIVAETIVGLLRNDPNSILNHPEFSPDPRSSRVSGSFTMADLIRIGTDLGPVAIDPSAFDPKDGTVNFGTMSRRFTWFGVGVYATTVKVITVRNESRGLATVSNPVMSGPALREFTVVPGGTCGWWNRTLQPGASCTVKVRFWPWSPGQKSATLTLDSDGLNGPLHADLRGVAG